MVPTDRKFADAVEAAIHAIEAKTDAEVVVVTAPHSGTYADVALACGAILAWLDLAFLVYSPIEFDPLWFPVDLLVAFAIGWWGSRRSRMLPRMVGAARRKRQVMDAARAAFVEETVHGTAARTGVLVYLSVSESEVVVLPDEGVLGRLPGGAIQSLRIEAGTLEGFIAGLARLGELLGAHLPATGENPDEIGNAPRVRA